MRFQVLLLLAFLAPVMQACAPVVAGGAVVGGAVVASDRRTSGAYVEDQGIEIKAANRISESLGDKVHINVTSYNRTVLVTGEAPSEETRQEVERIVRGIPNVRGVVNEVAIAGLSSFTARSNDTFITSKVKARFLEANKFQPTHIKVVTEGGVVYLLGIVTRQEAADATDLASTTSGVQKVVKLFEYLD
jgi:osmotically-inducible protein OsmY